MALWALPCGSRPLLTSRRLKFATCMQYFLSTPSNTPRQNPFPSSGHLSSFARSTRKLTKYSSARPIYRPPAQVSPPDNLDLHPTASATSDDDDNHDPNSEAAQYHPRRFPTGNVAGISSMGMFGSPPSIPPPNNLHRDPAAGQKNHRHLLLAQRRCQRPTPR